MNEDTFSLGLGKRVLVVLFTDAEETEKNTFLLHLRKEKQVQLPEDGV